MDFRVILILIAEALFAFLLLLRAGVLKSRRAVLVSVLLIAAAIGCTTGPLRLWNRVEDRLSDTAAVTLRTVGVVILLLLSIAFLVGDSYNPFLYFRF